MISVDVFQYNSLSCLWCVVNVLAVWLVPNAYPLLVYNVPTASRALYFLHFVTGDVDGSVDAILDTLDTYQSDQCRLHILHYGVGHVTEQDVDLAAAFKGNWFYGSPRFERLPLWQAILDSRPIVCCPMHVGNY